MGYAIFTQIVKDYGLMLPKIWSTVFILQR
ncbi:hypothetical protein BCEP27_20934 [Burkholderia cepacia]